MTKAPTICVNLIVRNEAHVVCELFDSIAPYIDCWVIVDTGSDDGTQELIRNYFAARGIPGELHQRPWQNFGANRTEALQLAQGHADYIWWMDADDLVVGTPDLSHLTADSYDMRLIRPGGLVFWRRHLFRSGLPWRWVGVVHEYSTCDEPHTEARLEGDYHIAPRRLGARNLDPDKYLRDAELLLAEVHRNPEDVRSVFYLAQSYRDYGDLRSARQWYARRAEMGGWAEEVFYSLLRVAECISALNESWPLVQDAYLKAWAYRPSRAEPLYAIAAHYRANRDWQLGYFFARNAAAIPLPTDILFVRSAVYELNALDEQAICAYWLGEYEESFALCQRLLTRSDLDDTTRTRIVTNRDFSVPAALAAAETYPAELAQSLRRGNRDCEVTVTVVTGSALRTLEHTLNTFLNCCADLDRVGRFLLIDTGLTDADRDHLTGRYPFLEIQTEGATDLFTIHCAIGGRFWLHLGAGWKFFAREPIISRLAAIFDTESDVYQIGLNFADAANIANQSAPQGIVRGGSATGRYVLTDSAATGPAMYETTRYPPTRKAPRTATLGEVIALKESLSL